MATKEQSNKHDNIERNKGDALSNHIEEQVIHTLGTPVNLLKVQARLLWENHYRVNVFVGPDVASAKVSNSYFLSVGTDGNILASEPKITKQYEPAAPGPATPRSLAGGVR